MVINNINKIMDLSDDEINMLDNSGGAKDKPRRKTLSPSELKEFQKKFQMKQKLKKLRYINYEYLDMYEMMMLGKFDDAMSPKELDAMEHLTQYGNSYCRNKINPTYIDNTFKTPGMNGVILEINTKRGPEYLGFILFKKHIGKKKKKGEKKKLDFKLLCTIPKKMVPEREGIPVGKLLMEKMEEFANKNGYSEIMASAVNEALPFYEKNKWKVSRLKNVKKKLAEFFGKRKSQETPIRKSAKDFSFKQGGKKRRKHSGINQQTGRLKKGYKYSGKKLKSGLPQIIKSNIMKGGLGFEKGKLYLTIPPSGNEYKFGVKYSNDVEKFMEKFRKKKRSIFDKLDFVNDPLSGEKLEKQDGEFVIQTLLDLNKIKGSNPKKKEFVNEAVEALKNENPDVFNNLWLKMKKQVLSAKAVKIKNKLSPKKKFTFFKKKRSKSA